MTTRDITNSRGQNRSERYIHRLIKNLLDNVKVILDCEQSPLIVR